MTHPNQSHRTPQFGEKTKQLLTCLTISSCLVIAACADKKKGSTPPPPPPPNYVHGYTGSTGYGPQPGVAPASPGVVVPPGAVVGPNGQLISNGQVIQPGLPVYHPIPGHYPGNQPFFGQHPGVIGVGMNRGQNGRMTVGVGSTPPPAHLPTTPVASRDSAPNARTNNPGANSSNNNSSSAPATTANSAGSQTNTNQQRSEQLRNEQSRVVVYNPHELSAEDRLRLGLDVEAVTTEDLRRLQFTSAASDNLVALLKDKLDNVSDLSVKSANQEFAKQIGLTTVGINWQTRRFVVTTLLDRAGKRAHYSFGGVLGDDLQGRFGSAKKSPNISGDLVCMDLNGGCRNIRIRLIDSQVESSPRTAYVVVRDTPAWMKIQAKHPMSSNNVEFQQLASVLFNTIENSGAPGSVATLGMVTSETVNGTSSFAVDMKLRLAHPQYPQGVDQLLIITGPLAKIPVGRSVQVLSSPVPTLTTVDGLTIPVDPDHGFISDTLKQIRLVGNDGKGQVDLALTVRANKPLVDEEVIVLTIGAKRNSVKYKDL